jgi:hypothetical protein
MSLQVGDWVRTENGEVGRVVHIYRLSAFVDLKGNRKDEDIKAYLVSNLTRIDSPHGKSSGSSAK